MASRTLYANPLPPMYQEALDFEPTQDQLNVDQLPRAKPLYLDLAPYRVYPVYPMNWYGVGVGVTMALAGAVGLVIINV